MYAGHCCKGCLSLQECYAARFACNRVALALPNSVALPCKEYKMSAKYDSGLYYVDHCVQAVYENFKPLTWDQYNALCDKIENLDKNL
jgi:hypothetical protein